MKEVIVAFLVALVAGAFINGFAVSGSSAPAGAATEPGAVSSGSEPGSSGSASSGTAVAETTDANFDNDVLKSTQPVLVDFYSENCGPCKQMAPVIDQVAGTYNDRVKVVKVDVDSNPRVTMQYNVNTIPTFIVFKNGERGESFTGLVPKGILAQTLDKALQ